MYRLEKNEVLFGEGKCALQMLCESEAPVYELNQKLIMRKVNKLKKEIANAEAIVKYTWRQYRLAMRAGCSHEEKVDRYQRLREVMDIYSVKEKRKELASLIQLLEQQ